MAPLRPPAGDAALAGGFVVINVLITAGVSDLRALPAAFAVASVHAAAVAWRRFAPEVVLAVQGATAFVVIVVGWPPVILGPAVVATVHALGSVRDERRAIPTLAVAIAAMAATVIRGGATADTAIGNGVVLVAAWWLGDRQRRAVERAESLERETDAKARQAVADERLRIARELHDVVAHALSVIAVQAGTGRVLIESDPTTAHRALSTIESESRAALTEMRRLLDVLRDEDAPAAALRPTPGLDDLETLVRATTSSGISVDLHIAGDRQPLPAGTELAAYRIVQEALTNVRRHAHATRVDVLVAWRDDTVDLEILDDGTGVPDGALDANRGHGLVSMRERAAVCGGTFSAGNRPGGGFRVAASIPWERPS